MARTNVSDAIALADYRVKFAREVMLRLSTTTYTAEEAVARAFAFAEVFTAHAVRQLENARPSEKVVP
jgi:hypothetical protein